MSGSSEIETDYLVVGAGALGMGFVDTLIEHSDADVVMIDRRHRPGGHWLDSYPFVQLHQPSMNYGVNSTPLGPDRVEPDGRDAGFYERASGTEICGYYDEVMRHRLLASGRVRFFPMCDYLGERRFRSRLTGVETDVSVRRSVVDATYMASRVPATDPPPFEVGRRGPVRPGRCAHERREASGRLRDHRWRQDRDGRRVLVARSRCSAARHHLDPSSRLVDPEPRLLPAGCGCRSDVRGRRPGAGSGRRVRLDRAGLRAARGTAGGVAHRPVRRAVDVEGRHREPRRAGTAAAHRERGQARTRRAHRSGRDHARARIDPDQSRSPAHPLRVGRTERQPAEADLRRRHHHAPADHACQPQPFRGADRLRRGLGRERPPRRTGCADRTRGPTRRSTSRGTC